MDKSTVQEVTRKVRSWSASSLLAMERIGCWHVRPNRPRSQSCQRYAKNVKKMENERRKQAVQLEEQENDAKPEEHVKMEVDDETNSRKTLEMRETDITKDMRKLEGIKSMDETNEKVHEENWQKEFAHIEQRRRDLLPEHEQCRRCLKQYAEFGGQVGTGPA